MIRTAGITAAASLVVGCSSSPKGAWESAILETSDTTMLGSVALEPVWEVRGDDLGRGTIAGVILDDGRVAFLSAMECSVFLYLPDSLKFGALPIGCGPGPNEISDPVAIARFGGNRLVVANRGRPAVSIIALDAAGGQPMAVEAKGEHVVGATGLRQYGRDTMMASFDTHPLVEQSDYQLLVVNGDSVTSGWTLGPMYPGEVRDRSMAVMRDQKFCVASSFPGRLYMLSSWGFDILGWSPQDDRYVKMSWSDHGLAIQGTATVNGSSDRYSRVVGEGITCEGRWLVATQVVGDYSDPPSSWEYLFEVRDSLHRPVIRRIGKVGDEDYPGIPMDARGDLVLLRDNLREDGPRMRMVRIVAAP